MRKEKVCFWNHHTLILQVSGQFTLETSGQKISTTGGEMLLIGKNQLGTLTKIPLPCGNYETIVDISAGRLAAQDFVRRKA